jgi:osmotically inducible protein OsmC
MKVLYTAQVTTVGGRQGRATASDGHLDVRLSIPEEMGGAGGDGTNPEQLFAAGYGACFQSALAVVARRAKVDMPETTITTRVSIGPNDEGGFILALALEVAMPGVNRAGAEEMVAQAHRVCPYSNATRGNIEVTLSVVD